MLVPFPSGSSSSCGTAERELVPPVDLFPYLDVVDQPICFRAKPLIRTIFAEEESSKFKSSRHWKILKAAERDFSKALSPLTPEIIDACFNQAKETDLIICLPVPNSEMEIKALVDILEKIKQKKSSLKIKFKPNPELDSGCSQFMLYHLNADQSILLMRAMELENRAKMLEANFVLACDNSNEFSGKVMENIKAIILEPIKDEKSDWTKHLSEDTLLDLCKLLIQLPEGSLIFNSLFIHLTNNDFKDKLIPAIVHLKENDTRFIFNFLQVTSRVLTGRKYSSSLISLLSEENILKLMGMLKQDKGTVYLAFFEAFARLGLSDGLNFLEKLIDACDIKLSDLVEARRILKNAASKIAPGIITLTDKKFPICRDFLLMGTSIAKGRLLGYLLSKILREEISEKNKEVIVTEFANSVVFFSGIIKGCGDEFIEVLAFSCLPEDMPFIMRGFVQSERKFHLGSSFMKEILIGRNIDKIRAAFEAYWPLNNKFGVVDLVTCQSKFHVYIKSSQVLKIALEAMPESLPLPHQKSAPVIQEFVRGIWRNLISNTLTKRQVIDVIKSVIKKPLFDHLLEVVEWEDAKEVAGHWKTPLVEAGLPEGYPSVVVNLIANYSVEMDEVPGMYKYLKP